MITFNVWVPILFRTIYESVYLIFLNKLSLQPYQYIGDDTTLKNQEN